MICDRCNTTPAERQAVGLSSDPLAVMDVCLPCWLVLADYDPAVRAVQVGETVVGVLVDIQQGEECP